MNDINKKTAEDQMRDAFHQLFEHFCSEVDIKGKEKVVITPPNKNGEWLVVFHKIEYVTYVVSEIKEYSKDCEITIRIEAHSRIEMAEKIPEFTVTVYNQYSDVIDKFTSRAYIKVENFLHKVLY